MGDHFRQTGLKGREVVRATVLLGGEKHRRLVESGGERETLCLCLFCVRVSSAVSSLAAVAGSCVVNWRRDGVSTKVCGETEAAF